MATKLDYLVPIGFLKKTRKFIAGHYSFKKLLGEVLNWINVPFADPCCDAMSSNTPVRFNVEGNTLERYDISVEGWIEATEPNTLSLSTALTAHAGGGQGSALALPSEYNEVTVAASAGDSVKLPVAVAGVHQRVVVKNNGASAIDVFPATGDSINTLSANTAIRIVPGDSKAFVSIDSTVWEASEQVVGVTDGSVGAPSVTFDTQSNMGLYKVSSTQLGVSVGGALKGGFNASGLFTSAIAEQISGSGITLSQNTISQRASTAVNITGSISAAAVVKGLITSTSAATVTATLDTAANIGTAASAVQGTVLDFFVDNIAGANIVTVAVNTGITAITAVITGGATLTVAAGTVAQFRLYFTSASVAKLARII